MNQKKQCDKQDILLKAIAEYAGLDAKTLYNDLARGYSNYSADDINLAIKAISEMDGDVSLAKSTILGLLQNIFDLTRQK